MNEEERFENAWRHLDHQIALSYPTTVPVEEYRSALRGFISEIQVMLDASENDDG